ncbi:dehydrodolichyl diphosphate syntase complex subunit DHDDS [Brachionus plicatilis]|uniref:Alkyl transferase n=1 Tax=Brachionus plicatilis TaxID=10195 RepID=A0A3M7SW81_BRAPC|nr:dehydrodolichyl diphosphate syntase complex subunit DHDDS [Brachionus plicatilis]
MTWFVDDRRTWIQRIFGNILLNGPVPKHVAIIMDGNRRYAKLKNIKKIEGHMSGFDKLVEALSWCFLMNVKEISVYAFSIENFKRSDDEVNALFDLAREKFQRLLDEKEKINKLKVCIRFFGNVSLLPQDLQVIISKVVQMSKHNKNLFMNICIAYTSRDEITMAVREISQGVNEQKILINDINEALIEQCLYTSNSFPVDLLVRTSGEVRLSDFLLWQCNATNLTFVKQMWPEFSVWNFYMAILNFQLNHHHIEKLRDSLLERTSKDIAASCKMSVIENRKVLVDRLKNKEIDDQENLQLLAKHLATEAIDSEIACQKNRTTQFLSSLNLKREDAFYQLSLCDI